MSHWELCTTDELMQLKRDAVETRDMRLLKEIENEMDRRSKYDE